MSTNSTPAPWMTRRPTRWSMPVCLQPRAPRHCRLIHADQKRPVRLARGGFQVRPQGHYQLEIGMADEAEQPAGIAVVTGPVRRTSDQEQAVTEDGRTLRRIDLQVARDDEGGRWPRFWWSRLEPLVVRLQYADGRDDYEQRLWLVVQPRRLWALWALLSSAILYGLIPWLSRTVLERGDLPTAWTDVLTVLSHPEVWLGLMLVILALWLMVVFCDRLQLAARRSRVRHEARREAQRYLQVPLVH